MLVFNHLTKQFKQDRSTLTVLNQVDLTISDGDFVSLIGPSGCGKSTLLSLIAGLDKPSAGQITLDGKQVKGPSADKGVVFQEAALFPWLTVMENVMFPLRKLYPKAKQKEIAQHYLRKVQLSKFADQYPHELSGGMQQRVSIARVLAMDPKLLLMDEPFGALDEQTRQVLQAELEKIWLDTKKTVVFVTHSIREAIKLSDRIIVMGARPSQIIADKKIDLARPRQQKDMLPLENELMQLLKGEIDKVLREELDNASGI